MRGNGRVNLLGGRVAHPFIAKAIWETYQTHGDLGLLREDVLTDPWYRPPETVRESLLYFAVSYCDVAAARMFIEFQESPDLPTSDGFPLLHIAVDIAHDRNQSNESLELIGVLLQHGADPNAVGVDGTALHRAAGWGLFEGARILLRHGADIEARMLADGELTPLMHAALMGQGEMVSFLLKAGADPSARCVDDMGSLTAQELVRCS